MTRQKMGFVWNSLVMLLAAIAFSACAPAETARTIPLSLTDTATKTKTVMPAAKRASTRTSTPEPVWKVVSIVSGEGHSCALISDGTVQCWGKNEFGQLGDGTAENRDAPVQVRGLKDVHALTAGWGHTCALMGDGAVKCWGYNKNGELGDYHNTDSNRPVDVNGLSTGVTYIAAGDDHTCAATEAGEIKCWGFNGTGQLGDGTNESRNIPVAVKGWAGEAVSLAAGWGHTCVLAAEGGVKCWGDDSSGQLGNNANAISSNSPVAVFGLTRGVAAVTAKGGHACALLDDGSVQCWGDNTYGQLGDGTAVNRMTPVPVTGLDGVQAVAAGWNHTCAIIAGQKMMCWGWNYFGQLGDRSMTTQVKPVSVTYLPGPAAAMGLGWRHSCAVIDPGLVMCWGANEYGQGWDGWLVEPGGPSATHTVTPDNEKSPAPSNTPALPQVSDFPYLPLDSGGNHNCVLTPQGGVKCWGENHDGQLGIGNKWSQGIPGDVAGLAGEAAGIAVGGNHSCALMRDGAVMCWGANFSGEIGDGTHVDRITPVAVLGLPAGATAVAAGGGHTCAVVPAGVYCWGANNNNQLGIGDFGYIFVRYPVPVDGLPSEIRTLSTISDHTCGLTRGGGAVCWGLNDRGQLGDGSGLPRRDPVPVAGLGSGVISVAAGYLHSCAVTAGGKVKYWGDNSYGQLGDGTHQPSRTPVDVLQGGDKAVRVVTGFYHSCYQTESGKVKCWGLNTEGQLGDQSFSASSKPVEVKALEDVLFLDAGDNHSCAILADNSIRCWGSNISGQLGNNGTASSSVPVIVIMNE